MTEVTAKDGGISFQQADQSIPFFPPEAAPILKWAPILEELNDYSLKVTGLKDGKYAVVIGGKKVAEYSSEELAKGVNLASAVLLQNPKDANPVLAQALAVKTAVEKEEQILPRSNFQHSPVEVEPSTRRRRIWSRNAWRRCRNSMKPWSRRWR